jgi:hypothetical protein
MITFPTTPPPQIDDTYTAAGKTWKWTGVAWQLNPRTLTAADITDFTTAVEGIADDADNLTTGTLADARLSSAVTASLGKADSALQPASVDYAGPYNNGIGYGPNAVVLWEGSLYKKISNFSNPGYPPSGADWESFTPANGSFDAYKIAVQNSLDGKAASSHGHALSDITVSGATTNQVPTWNGTAWVPATPVVTNFQPSPQYAADNAAHAQVSGFDGQPTAIFSRVNADYYQGDGIEYTIIRNGQYHGGVVGSWLLEYVGENGKPVATSTTATTYPWQATWTNGVTVVKAALPRIVGAPLAATATEGASVYAARADHAHPFPTAAQVGAAPAGNYATLDGTGKIPSTQLPSYVDDVVEYATLSALQADATARVSGKIYVTRDSGKIYRFSGGTVFIEISNSLELQNLMLPDSIAQISILHSGITKILSVDGVGVNGKNTYYLREETEYWRVYWTGSMWIAVYDHDGSDWPGESPNQKSSSNTQYPWQATNWVDYGTSGGVSRVGTYDAALAPKALAAQATSGIGTKAAREDHVHPLPTAAAIGAATTAQVDAKQPKTVYDDIAPAHAAGLEWVDTTTLRSYRSYNGAWVEIDRA